MILDARRESRQLVFFPTCANNVTQVAVCSFAHRQPLRAPLRDVTMDKREKLFADCITAATRVKHNRDTVSEAPNSSHSRYTIPIDAGNTVSPIHRNTPKSGELNVSHETPARKSDPAFIPGLRKSLYPRPVSRSFRSFRLTQPAAAS